MTVERRPRQFIAVWSDDGKAVKGSTFEESLFVDGQFWKNEQTPVPPEKFGDFGALFSSELQKQHDALVVEKTDLIQQVDSLTKQIETLITQLENAQKQLEGVKQETKTQLENKNVEIETIRQETQKQLEDARKETQTQLESVRKETQAQLVSKDTEVNTAKQEVAALKARTEFFRNQIKFDPRIIKPAAFKERLKRAVDSNDFVRLYADPLDQTLEAIAKTLSGWPDDVPMRLDHKNLLGPLQYLQQIDILTEHEMKLLLQDCTREEAFIEEPKE